MRQNFYLSIIFSFLIFQPNATSASDSERTEFEKQFIGRTWKDVTIRAYPLTSECRLTGGKALLQTHELMLNHFTCNNNRELSVISERIGLGSLRLVLDAFLFPELKDGEKLMTAGHCSFGGKTLLDFTALVRMGERESVDWQTGVLAAWVPNVQTRKYEPLSTRTIVCDAPPPPQCARADFKQLSQRRAPSLQPAPTEELSPCT